MSKKQEAFRFWGESGLTCIRSKYYSWHIPQGIANLLGINKAAKPKVYVNVEARTILLQF